SLNRRKPGSQSFTISRTSRAASLTSSFVTCPAALITTRRLDVSASTEYICEPYLALFICHQSLVATPKRLPSQVPFPDKNMRCAVSKLPAESQGCSGGAGSRAGRLCLQDYFLN